MMKRVLERDGWRCQKCGSLENLQIHHKTKRRQLGSDFPGNLAESHLSLPEVCILVIIKNSRGYYRRVEST